MKATKKPAEKSRGLSCLLYKLENLLSRSFNSSAFSRSSVIFSSSRQSSGSQEQRDSQNHQFFRQRHFIYPLGEIRLDWKPKLLFPQVESSGSEKYFFRF